MFYYHIWVRSNQYRGHDPLTYHSAHRLAVGAIVLVPMRTQKIPGVVFAEVAEPLFATKPIAEAPAMPSLPAELLRLAEWLHYYYPAPIGVIMQQFLPATLHPAHLATLDHQPLAPFSPPQQPPLTAEQRDALARMRQPDTYILHGRTGSGKTRLYTELAAQVLNHGQSVIVLSPEIGLASQTEVAFRRLFGERVVTLHSRLTPKEREVVWFKILTATEPLLVIGPRSALFSPVHAVGLIVVDEAHDTAYKQGQAPYYQAVRAASQLAHMYQCCLVFGSATPAITDYYLAQEKAKPIIQLHNLAITSEARHQTTVVDLKDHTLFSRAPNLSQPLIEAIAGSLARHEQSLLFLNRRGTARVTLCDNCGWQALCPRCDIPLVYHGDLYRLRCHVCGFTEAPPVSCPSCGHPSIAFKSIGTKAIVTQVQRIFPEARILRFDTDNLKSERLEQHYDRILRGEVDILIGTQLLAKGLDLPRLSTLGVILADSSLYLPDFTAQERTYQLLSQVLGRIGRGHLNSHAIIQTYQPKSKLLQNALQGDWDDFYNAELQERRQYLFPPYCYLLKLTCRSKTSAGAEKMARTFQKKLQEARLPIRIEGPAPAFQEKAGGSYRWQLIVKARQRSALLAVVPLLPSTAWSYDLDPIDLL